MKLIKTISLSILLVLSGASSLHAIGDREKGALIGAGAVIVLGSLLGNMQNSSSYDEPRVIYREPRPTVIYREPYVRERVIIIDNHPPRYRPSHRYYDDRYRYYR